MKRQPEPLCSENVERLATVIDGLTKGLDALNLGVTMTDVSGKIMYVNHTEASLHNRSVDELVGRDVGILAPAGKRRPLTKEQLKNLKSWKRESTNVRKDGTTFPVLLRSEVVFDQSGEPLGMVTTCENVGELRATQEALNRSEANYAALVENASHGICRSSVSGEFLTVNQALVDILGYEEKAELLQANLVDDVYSDPTVFWDLVGSCGADSDRIADMEVEWRARNGDPRTVRLSGRAVRSKEDEVEAFEFIVEDVTGRRQLEEQLRQAQKLEALGQLTGGIAHDFNNILTVIQGNIGLMAAELPTEYEQLCDDLRETQKATRRGAALVKKLLAFSRREELSKEVLDLADTIGGASKTLKRLLPEHIDVKVVLEDKAGSVYADPNAVEQILLNLATNARDAMPNGGLLYIETRRAWLDEEHRVDFGWGRAGEYACVVVSDTGEGMDEKTKKRIFEPFFTTKPAGQGTGLGMAMIHGLVKQHDGFVHVYSEAGEGTTMKVFFPIARRDSIEIEATSYDPDEDDTFRGTETVLVVEDDPQIRNVAKRVLEMNGYTVLLAEDGEQGLLQYKKNRSEIELVISDVIMPKLGGPGLYEAIFADVGPTRFMFMSGHAAHYLRMSGQVNPSVPFVYKPWTDAELLRRVRDSLDMELDSVKAA